MDALCLVHAEPAPAPAPQTPQQECASIGDLSHLADGLTAMCCDDESDGCVDGMPAHCDSDCGPALLEVQVSKALSCCCAFTAVLV